MKRKLMIGLGLLVLTLSACSAEATEIKAESTMPNVQESNLEDATYTRPGYLVDKRTGCLYKASVGNEKSYLTAVIGANGVFVGCRENPDAYTVEHYFKGN